jgi:hypothetical protein
MKTKAWVLVTTALAPFGASFIPPLYVLLVYYFSFTYPVSAFCGLTWTGLFCIMYFRAESGDRKKLRWYAPLAIFAFIVPIHLILVALGVPPFLPRNFTPS